MRAYFNDYQVNGKPILVPDADGMLEWNDLDDDSSGRDESGIMHRTVLRYRIPKWNFEYASLTKEELVYMRNLFKGLATFTFTYKDENGDTQTCAAYSSNDSVTYHDASTGLYRNYKINIIAC